mmetsp:Transcript_9800/g.28296  ORF Transcript_9800/g.28296 Transcript_9800/m.28296 type:complete len:318 (+) Transcript_9800:682-1635(+)
MESKYSRLPLPSQMPTPFSFNSFALVEPLTNHNNSSATPLQNTRLLVNNGNDLLKSYRMEQPNLEMVPVPVLSPLTFPSSMISLINSKYCISSCFCSFKIFCGRIFSASTRNFPGGPLCATYVNVVYEHSPSFTNFELEYNLNFSLSNGNGINASLAKYSFGSFPAGGFTSVKCTASHCSLFSASSYTFAPPITNTFSMMSLYSPFDNVSNASSIDARANTPSGKHFASLSRPPFSLFDFSYTCPDADKTTFNLPGSGRNFSGIDSQVFLPIITAFCVIGSDASDVKDLKCFISFESFHGKAPFFPTPPSSSAATTT